MKSSKVQDNMEGSGNDTSEVNVCGVMLMHLSVSHNASMYLNMKMMQTSNR